jgi:hypothetical protein
MHQKYRGSSYRGVSLNGKAWQIMLMIDQEKIYLSTVDDPYKAAQMYDIAIIQAKGFSSKLNFNYTTVKILAILQKKSISLLKKELVNQRKHDQTNFLNRR